MPRGTYADDATFAFHRRPFADYLEELVRRCAKPGIEVEITRDFLDEKDLITWCGRNSLNCFLYNRDQPGLAATTDQAIASARPLAVSTNPTFRHLHPYIKPYPFRTLRESMRDSLPEVLQLRQDWDSRRFAQRFEEVLAHFKLLPDPATHVVLRREEVGPRVPVLLVNHPQKRCGIHQYGEDIFNALKKSKRYEFTYAECSDRVELQGWVAKVKPRAILYNYYPFTMPWLDADLTHAFDMPQVEILHEVTQAAADEADRSLFDFHLCPDPTLEERNPFTLKIPRLIPTFVNTTPVPEVPTIGSFGFGFADKGFERVVEEVEKTFDRAVILLHMPRNEIVDSNLDYIAQSCRNMVTKPGIEIRVNHEFLDKPNLMAMLGANSINVFLYDLEKDRGISSVVEKAIGAMRPVAVNGSGMFRHVHGAVPSIRVEDRSIREIMEGGIAPLVPFLNQWNEASFIKGVDEAFDRILESGPVPRPQRGKDVSAGGPRRILWVRPDAIGDTVMAMSMLPAVASHWPEALMTVVCQEVVAPLYEACPHVHKVVPFDRTQVLADPAALEALGERVREVGADLCLHSVSSREALGDVLSASSRAPERIAFGGDTTNMSEEEHLQLDPIYTTLIPALEPHEREMDRHQAFLRALGCGEETLAPRVWLRPDDEVQADNFFRALGVLPRTAIAVFPGSKADLRLYPRLGEAIGPLATWDRRVLIFGGPEDRAEGDAILAAAGGMGANLCGNLPLRLTAALLQRCRLAVGVENGLVQLACAVGLPQVVALGGTFFGRFLPHSSLTSAALLPLDCYLCDGHCPFDRPHCIRDLEPDVLRAAVLHALEGQGAKPRLFVQTGWKGPGGGPFPIDLAAASDPELVEVIPVAPPAREEPQEATGEGEPRTTVFCAVWHKDPHRFERLVAHQACLDAQTVPVDRVYVFDGGDTPPDWLKGRVVVNREPLLIYEAWNMGICRVRTPYVMNLNLDDRLCPQGVEILENVLDGGADLAGGEWRICFSQEDTDAVGPIATAHSIPFSPRWPPSQGGPVRLGSGTGERGTFGPACLWRMKLHEQFARYPWKFGDGEPIRIIGDTAWWGLLMKHDKVLKRLPVVIGHYHSHPNDQAEFRNPSRDEEARLARVGLSLT